MPNEYSVGPTRSREHTPIADAFQTNLAAGS